MEISPTFVFFGTDLFAVTVLETLKKRNLIPELIITTPDKPVGRKHIITPPPAKVWAIENNIKVAQPNSLKNDEQVKNSGLAYVQYDFFVTASYGKIIPQTILDLPKHGCLNIHPSLLPKHRGASPLEYTILNGDTETGVTVMLMDAEMDHGPILATAKIGLTGNETYFDLRNTLATLGAETLADILPNYLASIITPTEQNHTAATYTKLIEKTDGEIDPFNQPEIAWRKYRAFIDWPGVYFFATPKQSGGGITKTRILVKKARFENNQFIIDRVLPEGKKEIDWKQFKQINS